MFALSWLTSINEGSEKNDDDCCVPNALVNVPCICGAKAMGPCVAMLSGCPKGPRGDRACMKESTKCPLKEPAVVIDAWSQEENRKKGKSFSEPPRLEVKVGKQPRKRRHASRTGPVRTSTGHVHTWPTA